MTEPPNDTWPTPDGETVVVSRDRDTLVGAPPPPAAPTPPPAAGPPPDRRVGAGMLLGIGALLLVAAGIAIAWFLTHRDSNKQVTTVVVHSTPRNAVGPAKVAVPRVVGMKESEALVRLAQIGLQPKEIHRPTKQPTNTVLSQKPSEAKEVAKGTTVTLVIDSGAPKHAATTPTTTAAQQTNTTPTTTAAEQTTTAPATTTTAAPPQPTTATVPDAGGQTEAAAASAFGKAGLLPSLVWVPGSDPLGTVVAQGKSAGSNVPWHSHVQLNLSIGPNDNPKVSVPNVVGQTLKQAVGTLNGAHLRLIYLRFPVTSQSQAGKVVQQSPLGGSAPQNAQILVFLGSLNAQ